MTTSGSEWRKAREEGVEVELPSGRTAKLRPISLQWLLKAGRIPDGLTAIVSQMISGKLEITNVVDTAKEIISLNELMVTACMVEPKVVPTPTTDEEIGLEDLTDEEVDFIVAWAAKPAQTMDTFRKRQVKSVETVYDSQDLFSTP